MRIGVHVYQYVQSPFARVCFCYGYHFAMPIDHVLWIDIRALDIILTSQRRFSSMFFKRRMPEALIAFCPQSA